MEKAFNNNKIEKKNCQMVIMNPSRTHTFVSFALQNNLKDVYGSKRSVAAVLLMGAPGVGYWVGKF